MFESLAERIREDEKGTASNAKNPVFWLIVVAITLAVLSAIYFGMKLSS